MATSETELAVQISQAMRTVKNLRDNPERLKKLVVCPGFSYKETAGTLGEPQDSGDVLSWPCAFQCETCGNSVHVVLIVGKDSNPQVTLPKQCSQNPNPGVKSEG